MAEENLQAGNSNGVHTLRQAQPACAAGHLSADGTAFLEEHRVRGYEVGPDQKTTILTMANLLQVPCNCLILHNCVYMCLQVLEALF